MRRIDQFTSRRTGKRASSCALLANHSSVPKTLQTRPLDTPYGLQPHGCSVPRRSQRHASLKVLPEPLYIPGGVVVPMQARSTVQAAMPAHRQAFVDQDATTRTGLAGVG